MKIINTKVSDTAYDQLCNICKSKGLTVYELLQGVIESLVRYMSDKYNLSAELETLMHTFNKLEGWRDAFNIVDPTAEPEVVGAIYLIQDKRKANKEGKGMSLDEQQQQKASSIRPVYVKGKGAFFGAWEAEVNVQNILEETFCICAPTVYRSLRRLAVELGTSSVLETILTLIRMYGNDADEAIYRQLFEDANRSEFGLKPHEGTPFRRKHKKDIELIEGTIHFEPEDTPGTDKEHY